MLHAYFLEGNGGAKRRSCRPDGGVHERRNAQIGMACQAMPHPFCTSTHIRPPPAGRPPLHRADARCAKALEYPSDRFRGVLRHEKNRVVTSTPTGLKRLKTQITAFRGNENGKGTPSGVPQPIHKRKLILVKEEFDASSFGGGAENRTPVHTKSSTRLYKLIQCSIFR